LQDDGWWLRRDQVWSKPNPMPESCKDRCTSAHEYLFHLSKSPCYYFDHEAIKEPATSFGRQHSTGIQPPKVRALQDNGTHGVGGDLSINYERQARNKRSVWTIATAPFPEAHFATFPPALVEPCILAGTSERGVCPACGAPWERVAEKSASGGYPRDGVDRGTDKRGIKVRAGDVITQTIGWRASCRCNADDPVPALVLDPFLGAGTTALVADRLGRHCLGLELSPGYAEMAGRRTASAAAASEKGRHRQSQRRPSVSLCGSLSQREPDANRRVGAGQISTAPRGPLPRRSHAQKIFSRNSGRGCGPDCYIQTFDFACFCRCQFDFLVSLLGSKTDDFTPFLS
jgi:hypothetical protein